jgi:hypothetical protein
MHLNLLEEKANLVQIILEELKEKELLNKQKNEMVPK